MVWLGMDKVLAMLDYIRDAAFWKLSLAALPCAERSEDRSSSQTRVRFAAARLVPPLAINGKREIQEKNFAKREERSFWSRASECDRVRRILMCVECESAP